MNLRKLSLMADSTPKNATPSNNTISCCSYQPTVTLHDWWLVRLENDVQGKRLAIAGVSSRKGEAMRVFVSAPIIKAYDTFSLETADGKCVLINGFIDEQRTLENGFSPRVFSSFLFGFPPNWENLACFGEGSINDTALGGAVSGNGSTACAEILSDVSGMEKSITKHDIKVCQQKKQLAAGDPLKHLNNENSISVDLGNCVAQGLTNPALLTPIQSQLQSQRSTPPEQLVNKSASRISNSGGIRHSARLRDSKVCQQRKQLASGDPLRHLNKENSISVDLDNCDAQGLRNPAPVTPIQSQLQSQGSTPPEQLVNRSVSRISSSGGIRHSARLRDIKVCQQSKQLASGDPLKHLNNGNSISVDLKNCDAQGLRSPALVTPIQSQLQSQLSTPPEQFVNKSASRISRTLSTKTKGCYKKKSMKVETKVVRPKEKLNKSASAVKKLQEKDRSHLIKENQQKISTISPQSWSFKKSRSGRLLLPPLEFWRNQIPIYDANHEITKIQEGACLISPCRGSSPSLNRLLNQM